MRLDSAGRYIPRPQCASLLPLDPPIASHPPEPHADQIARHDGYRANDIVGKLRIASHDTLLRFG